MDFDGMSLTDAAAIAGETREATRRWLSNNGYRVPDGIVRRIPNAADRAEQEAELDKRRVAYSSPCFRCGAARDCAHRGDIDHV